MGKIVTVKTGYTAVLLPNKSGDGSWANYKPADTVTVTEAEYAAFNDATLGAITLTTSGLPDPYRVASDPQAETLTVQTQFTAATGGPVNLGANNVVGPAAGVTYEPNGFLVLAANNPATGVKGPKPGSVSVVEVFHTQGAVVSVAPVAKSWFGGVTRTDAGAGTTNSSDVVTDALITAADFGKAVSGAGIPANSFVGTVTAGVSFLLSSTSGTQTNVNATATATVSIKIGTTVLTKWAGGTVPTFTATVGAIDYFRFVTFDGGATLLNTLTVKDVK